MCGTVMRGADVLPGSKATSRAKASYRNLGYLVLIGGETPILLILAIGIFAATWVAEIYAARLLDPTD